MTQNVVKTRLTLEAVEAYLEDHRWTDDHGQDKAYCAKYEVHVNGPDDQIIRAFFTTKRLIDLGPDVGGSINIDATHKVTHEGLPAILLGTQDSANHFHVNGIMIASHEKSADYECASYQSCIITYGIMYVSYQI